MSSNSFRIISWDVGIIHLAYCVLEIDCLEEKSESKTKSKSKTKPHISIIDWDEINLLEDVVPNLVPQFLVFKSSLDKKSACSSWVPNHF